MKQHTTPCRECPWRRESAPGWLGTIGPEDWIQVAVGPGQQMIGEPPVLCHLKSKVKKEDGKEVGPQCAGIAIFRRNVCHLPARAHTLVLPKDTENVFATRKEFVEHHTLEKKK